MFFAKLKYCISAGVISRGSFLHGLYSSHLYRRKRSLQTYDFWTNPWIFSPSVEPSVTQAYVPIVFRICFHVGYFSAFVFFVNIVNIVNIVIQDNFNLYSQSRSFFLSNSVWPFSKYHHFYWSSIPDSRRTNFQLKNINHFYSILWNLVIFYNIRKVVDWS